MIHKICRWAIAVMGALALLGVVELGATEFGMIAKMAGEGIYSHFGVSVASAGDVNGDGYGDVIVGASGYTDTGSGAAYIFFGGQSMDTIYDVKIVGELWGMGLGQVVASAGDVNGDGYDDVLVGGHYYHGGPHGTDSLAVIIYVYFGGQNMDSLPDVRIVTEDVESGIGYYPMPAAASAGDVNGDGYDDVIVGVPWHRVWTHPSVGAAQIYFGGLSMDSLYDVRLLGEVTYGRFGYTVASAGDVNGDGYDDVIVSEIPSLYGGYVDTGRVYLFYGGVPMDETYDVKMVGRDANEWFGYSLASAGDVNGDGYDDVTIGAFGYDDSAKTNTGAARIYFGGASMDSLFDVILKGEGADDHFGISVSSAGDVNGDGYDDVIVGAETFDTVGGPGLGAAYIYLGGSTFDTLYYARIVGEEQSNHLGYSVSGAGDVDGNGHDDVIVGALYYDITPYGEEGAAYVYGLSEPMIGESPYFNHLQMRLNIAPSIAMNILKLDFYAEGGHVEINIVDASGRNRLTVLDGTLSSGWHERNLDVSGISDGVYFVVLRINGTFITTRKFQIVR